MADRLKGQEVEVVTLVNGLPQDSLTLAQSLEFTFKTELLQEGYLGETTDRYDTIYKGVSGKVQYHLDDPDFFGVIAQIINKARRRTPGVRFNIKNTLNFPNGRRARILHKDVSFGPLPINTGSRSAYTQFSNDFACSDSFVLPL